MIEILFYIACMMAAAVIVLTAAVCADKNLKEHKCQHQQRFGTKLDWTKSMGRQRRQK